MTCDAGHDGTVQVCTAGVCGTCEPLSIADPRFVDNDNGTVTDRQTCLVWEKKTTDGSVHDVNNNYSWSSTGSAFDGTAKTQFFDTLNDLAGSGVHCFTDHCDWRLPSVGRDGGSAELETIVDKTQGFCSGGIGACADPALGPTASWYYWSSTTDANFSNFAWYVYFHNGDVGGGNKSGSNRVRAVRGGP